MHYYDLLSEIMTKGTLVSPRSEPTKEIRNVTLVIDKPQQATESKTEMAFQEGCGNFICSKAVRPFEKVLEYEKNELAWYFSCDRRAEKIIPYARLWDKIKNEDGTANSNYGYLVFKQKTYHPSLYIQGMKGFEWAVNRLIRDEDGRGAVITYNNGSYNYVDNKDYICTQCQMFLIRDNRLHCTVPLRSSDAILGLTFNMPWWSLVQQQLRHALLHKYTDLQLGDITVNIQSAHIYERHFDLVNRMLKDGKEEYFIELKKKMLIGATFEWYRKNLSDYIKITKVV